MLSVKVTGGVPPLCVNVWLNGAPAVPVVTAGFTTDDAGQVTVSVKFCDAWCGLFFSAKNTSGYGAGGIRCRSSGQRARAVAVVLERDAGRQVAGEAQRRRRLAGDDDLEVLAVRR